MVTGPATLRALPVAVHSASRARRSPTELARFEEVVDATDAAVASSMHARRAASAATGTQTEGEAAAALGAVLAAIGAITNASVVPSATETKRELVQWTLTTIKEWRDASAQFRVPGPDPGIADPAACMELVHRLNARLGGAAFD